MSTTIRPGQAAKIEIRDLQVSKAHQSLYEEWLKQGNSGDFNAFLSTLRPEISEESLRRIVEAVLDGRGTPAVDISKDALAAAVAELLPARLLDSQELAEQVGELLPKLSDEDFIKDDEKGISIKPARAISKAEFEEWRKGITSGQTAVQADIRTLVINDWFTPEMQADVLSETPQLIHSRAIYDIMRERAKPGMRIRMLGNFNMAKLDGVEPETFGADGRTPDAPELASALNGCQPTMILHFDNWDVDFSQCRFRVMTMMTDGYAVAGYKGKNRFLPGAWFTKTVLDLDPDRRAADDWTVLGGPTGLFPPIDGTTGFAEKGYANAGFNTTNRHKWAGNYRSNALVTSGLNSGGYGGQFPQPDGTAQATWGVWRDGGQHGNMGSGGYIFQLPEIGKAGREAASITVQDHYARGFITYGIEVGLEAKPNGDPFGSDAEVWEYVPQNVYLVHTQVEDCYEGGIQANRFVNLWELHSRVYRMGHPNSGFTYHKPDTDPSAFINDPGYGSSSRRKTPQINRFIIGCWYIDVARKGIDAHTLAGLYIYKVRIRAKIWGIQICFDEIYTKTDEPSQSAYLANQLTIRDVEIFAGLKGLDFTNGSFAADKHVNSAAQRLYEMRFRALVDNVQIFAPIGFFDNYGRGNYVLRDVTSTCAYPYGKLPNFNPTQSRGFWFGSQAPSRYGVPFNIRLEGCTAQNSPDGNYHESFLIQPVNLLTMRDCIADVTPFTTDTVMPGRYLRGKDVTRSGQKSKGFVVADIGGVKVSNSLFDNCHVIDKSNGISVTRFDYKDEAQAPAAPQEQPSTQPDEGGQSGNSTPPTQGDAPAAEIPAVVRFGMASATSTVVRDDSGAVEVVMGGSNPPADWRDMADVSGEIKFVKGRLKANTMAAGVFPMIKLDLDGDKESTILMPIRVLSLGNRATVISLGAGSADGVVGTGTGVYVDKKTDTNTWALRNRSEYSVSVNGQANTADTRGEYDKWYIVSYTGKLGGEYLALGTQASGNGQLSADYGEGLTIWRNHTPSPEELESAVNTLKAKYGIE